MKPIPTAKEFYNESDVHLRTYEDHDDNLLDDLSKLMIEFAKLHVEAALKEASEKAELEYADGKYDCPDYCEEPFNMACDDLGNCHYIDRKTILNAYPLTNIK